MSTKADKGDRKREIEQSPMKKKFRDSAISSEDLDSAIASRIELAFKEHQSTLNSVVNSAVRDAVDSVLIPALRELREDILATNKSVNLLTRIRTWTLSELFVCTCHCFQTDKVKQDKMNLDKLYIILKV